MAFFLLGLFNHNGYTLVQSLSQSLAAEFDRKNAMALFQFAMTLIMMITRYCNGTVLVNISHKSRFNIVVILGISSFILLSLAAHEAILGAENYFYVALLASMMMGVSMAMGEATFLGFLNGFPSFLVGFVSSGTGFAGISANMFNLALKY